MFPVSDIWDEVKKLNGNCNDTVAYRKLNRAVEILANKADWDPLVGYMDISCEDQLVTLPREIETPIAISYGNWPALGRGQLFRFHLNGPGDNDSASFRWWQDGPEAVTFRELCEPRVLAATPCESDDVGQIIWVYGFDEDRKPIRYEESPGVWVDGYPFTVAATLTVDPNAPLFSQITRVRKPVTAGSINLWSVEDGVEDHLLGIYAWDDTEPVFRRLRVDRASDLVRIHYRRRNFKLRTQNDLIPLHNPEAVVMMVRALKCYDDLDFENATACESTAVRWLTEEQFTRNPAISEPIQVVGPNLTDDDDIN